MQDLLNFRWPHRPWLCALDCWLQSVLPNADSQELLRKKKPIKEMSFWGMILDFLWACLCKTRPPAPPPPPTFAPPPPPPPTNRTEIVEAPKMVIVPEPPLSVTIVLDVVLSKSLKDWVKNDGSNVGLGVGLIGAEVGVALL